MREKKTIQVMQVAEPYYIPIKLTKEQKRILKIKEPLERFEKLAATGLKNFAVIEQPIGKEYSKIDEVSISDG